MLHRAAPLFRRGADKDAICHELASLHSKGEKVGLAIIFLRTNYAVSFMCHHSQAQHGGIPLFSSNSRLLRRGGGPFYPFGATRQPGALWFTQSCGML